jgi:hypothetical protein
MAVSCPIAPVVEQSHSRRKMTKKIRKLVRKKLGGSTKLYKTTIVIWSEYRGDSLEIDDLAREAMSGDALCTKHKSEKIEHPNQDADWDNNIEEFFNLEVRPKKCPLPRKRR